VRWIALLTLAISSGCAGVSGGTIVKVLPHYLDNIGRHSNGPSLLHRDIYQKRLRDEPELINALRFDIKWRGNGMDSEIAKLRIEVRSSIAGVPPQVFEQPVKSGGIANWTAVLVNSKEYKKIGKMESWRATLLAGDKVLAERKSFLW